jgi:uncharacterized protein YqgV (UPF0045/DUF77 family)
MATVYITQQLSSEVASVIKRMREAEITTNNAEVGKPIELDTSEFLTKAMWGNYLHLKDQLPAEWMSVSNSPTLHVHVPIDDAGNKVVHSISFRNQNVPNRPNNDRWNEPKISCKKAYLEANVDMAGVQNVLNYLDRVELNAEIKARWAKVEGDIMAFLGKCKSLNEALKLWPGVKMYIPREYIERVERKVERKVREKEILDDTPVDTLTAAAIAARLSGITA